MTQPIPSDSPQDPANEDRPEYALRYTVISVEKSKGPEGTTGNDWYRYEVTGPGSPIIGYRRGNKSEVLEYLDEFTAKIEERMNTRKSPRAAGRKVNRAPASRVPVSR